MSFGDIHARFSRDFPLGEFAHIDLPNEYDPVKVDSLVTFDFASAVSRTSLSHRTWYIPAREYNNFMSVIDSGLVTRKVRG